MSVPELQKVFKISSSAIKAQQRRMELTAGNLANIETSRYQRQSPTFASMMDRESGVPLVRVQQIVKDTTPVSQRHDPGHPDADENGIVYGSNVNRLIEVSDMLEAHRSSEANLTVIETVRTMVERMIDVIRA